MHLHRYFCFFVQCIWLLSYVIFFFCFFFFNDTATTEIYTLSLHDALPISPSGSAWPWGCSSASGRPARRPACSRSWPCATNSPGQNALPRPWHRRSWGAVGGASSPHMDQGARQVQPVAIGSVKPERRERAWP